MLEKESSLQQIKIQQLEGEDWPRVRVRLEAGPVGVSRVSPRWKKWGDSRVRVRVWLGLGPAGFEAGLRCGWGSVMIPSHLQRF